MAKVKDLEQTLAQRNDTVDKAMGEIRKKLDEHTSIIEELRRQLEDADLSPGAEAQLKRLETSTKALDDIVPDPEPAPDAPAGT